MKIEELHEILKKSHKKHVREIEEIPCYKGFGPAYKEFYITKGELTIIITQVGQKECFDFWVQNDVEGEGATISSKMKGSTVVDLVDLIM